MKVALLTTQIPFVRGGAEMHVNNLRAAIERAGHEVEILNIPFNDNPIQRIEDQIVAMRLLDASCSWGGNIDFAIGMKFPAYMIPSVFIKMDELPRNTNGKIDRLLLKNKANEEN